MQKVQRNPTLWLHQTIIKRNKHCFPSITRHDVNNELLRRAKRGIGLTSDDVVVPATKGNLVQATAAETAPRDVGGRPAGTTCENKKVEEDKLILAKN